MGGFPGVLVYAVFVYGVLWRDRVVNAIVILQLAAQIKEINGNLFMAGVL